MASLLTYDNLVFVTPGAHEIIDFDFSDDLADGDSIKSVGAGTSVTATDESGIPADIISDVEISTTFLLATLVNTVNGKDYLVTYRVQAENSGEHFDKFLVVRARNRGLVL